MITYKKGNLLDSKCDYIVHQVNCQGVMGSGIAKQIRDRWPHVYTEYKWFLDCSKNIWKRPALGRLHAVYEQPDYAPNCRIIVNFFSQFHYLPRNVVNTDYDAFKRCCEELRIIVGNHTEQIIGFPYKIGCGLAGGDWAVVSKIIEETFQDYNVEIWEYEDTSN